MAANVIYELCKNKNKNKNVIFLELIKLKTNYPIELDISKGTQKLSCLPKNESRFAVRSLHN